MKNKKRKNNEYQSRMKKNVDCNKSNISSELGEEIEDNKYGLKSKMNCKRK